MTPRRHRQRRRSLCRAAGQRGLNSRLIQSMIQGSTFEWTEDGHLLQLADLNGKRYIIGMDVGFKGDKAVQVTMKGDKVLTAVDLTMELHARPVGVGVPLSSGSALLDALLRDGIPPTDLKRLSAAPQDLNL